MKAPKWQLILGCLLGFCGMVQAQEPQVFTLADFDVKGPVKSILVLTKYGQEEFNFNPEGMLAKSVTLYNVQDRDVTHYKYQNGKVVEKRREQYRGGEFDRQTSMAHIYQYDTVGKHRLLETILSYDKSFMEKNEYGYDSLQRLRFIRKLDDQGVYDIKVDYRLVGEDSLQTFSISEEIQKKVLISHKTSAAQGPLRMVTTHEYVEGSPNTGHEQVYDSISMLIRHKELVYDSIKKNFVSNREVAYSYNEKGLLAAENITQGNKKRVKEYIYQYDGERGNWIKKIIIPENSYITRRIQYYPVADTTAVKIPKG